MVSQRRSILIALFFLCVCALSVAAQSRQNYLFAYFKNNGEDGLHLAASKDGLKWTALNEDRPFLTPEVGSQKLMRDPCVILGPDGVFHLVWTTGWRGHDIGIAHSKDLIRWSEQKAVPVMAHEPGAINCWAPEIVYDEANRQYLIFWATTIPGRFAATDDSGGNGLNHRLYYTTTKDFRTYSKAELFYDDGFNVIDGTIVREAGRYVMILKDETAVPTRKNLRLAWSDKLIGPYGQASAPVTISWVEGPTAIKIENRWMVFFDLYRDKRYGAVRSSDWRNWEVVTDQLAFPAGARHGTVLTVSDEVLRRLTPRWVDALNQSPAWYFSEEAVRIADNILLYQRASGGWPKNIEMAGVLSRQGRAEIAAQQIKTDSTIDNGATYTQLKFLSRVFNATKETRFKEGFLRGFDYLIKAQYANGGWPQYYPNLTGYYTRITYNDDAMIGVMELLAEVARKNAVYAFLDEDRRRRAQQAVEQGVECILRTQIIVNGRRTAWCAQHDENTLAPAPARTYEKVSLSGSETVGIVRFLMGIERPSPQVREAIEAAVAWLEQAKLTGIKLVETPDPVSPKGFDRVVVNDPKARPLWARFYEIGTNRPIFSGRDGVIKAGLAEIEYERRTGYNWYTTAPDKLLADDYPKWRRKRQD